MMDLSDRLPVGISGFPKIRELGLIYVDKTDLIHQLVQKPREYFLARPRRFGKSLLLSAFESLFRNGVKQFDGLKIANLWQDRTYPVVRIDFSGIKEFRSIEQFQSSLTSRLIEDFGSVGFRFDSSRGSNLMEQLRTWLHELPTASLVILVDEYDAPLTANINNADAFSAIRSALSKFYATVKEEENCLRFFFITGITKFRNASIFSELNNITDISLEPAYGTLLGLTEGEIDAYFGDHIQAAARALGMEETEVRARLRSHYDGYCFERSGMKHVYAPWSVLKFFDNPGAGFANYWYESGGQPTVLMEHLRKHDMVSPECYGQPHAISLAVLSASQDFETISPELLLAQTGYLTIKTVTSNGIALLGYPNEEVSESMAQLYADRLIGESPFVFARMSELPHQLATGDLEQVAELFNLALSSVSYENAPIKSEAACRMCIQVLLIGASMIPAVEVQNNLGRSDLEVTTGGLHWVFEFKFLGAEAEKSGKSGEELLQSAVEQMKTRRYGEQYLRREALKRVAMVYSEAERRFVSWTAV